MIGSVLSHLPVHDHHQWPFRGRCRYMIGFAFLFSTGLQEGSKNWYGAKFHSNFTVRRRVRNNETFCSIGYKGKYSKIHFGYMCLWSITRAELNRERIIRLKRAHFFRFLVPEPLFPEPIFGLYKVGKVVVYCVEQVTTATVLLDISISIPPTIT